MASNEHYFVEWKEQYVSKERGNRVVHYFLKDNTGESILAVVGTERSVRHMFYVVSEEFVNAYGSDNSVHAGFRWRSRREVVNWLTSMLSKQHRQGDYTYVGSPKDDSTSEMNALKIHMLPYKGRLARNLKSHHPDISWSGTAWTCGKQLKHYPAFRRNGISIAVQSFVFVMAEKENRYIAYLEDMYEDRKCQKKVKVRWFHLNKEVKGVVSRNSHPKEVFITPYIQVISAECVDGPAIVLTRKHFEKCMAVFPPDLLGGVHFCFRQFKSNRIKPFKLSKLRGYFDQSIFSCFSPDFFDEEELNSGDDVKVGAKRNRSLREHHKSTYDLSCKRPNLLSREPNFLKHVEGHLQHSPVFALNEKVEFLCQDSGIRGCWFRCTVIEVSRRQIKIVYDDIKDEDSGTNLEEWIPAFRVAKADKLGMRNAGRPTVRPAHPSSETSPTFEVGDPADAWWSDGWWEGIICGTRDGKHEAYQIYVPGENLHLNIEQKDLRVSKDWVGDRWVDVTRNPNILSVISSSTNMETKLSTSSAAVSKEVKADNSPISCEKVDTIHKLSAVEEEFADLEGMTLTNVPLKDDCTDDCPQRVLKPDERQYCCNDVAEAEKENADCDSNGANVVSSSLQSRNDDCNQSNNIDDNNDDNNLVECEIAEMQCDEETMGMLTES